MSKTIAERAQRVVVRRCPEHPVVQRASSARPTCITRDQGDDLDKAKYEHRLHTRLWQQEKQLQQKPLVHPIYSTAGRVGRDRLQAVTPVLTLPWKNFATSVGLRGSVHPHLEQGSIDATGARFPTALSEMVGSEQREQTMFAYPNWHLHDQRGCDGVRALLAARSQVGQEVKK